MAASRAAVRAGYRTLWRTATNTFRGDTRAIVAGRMELRDHVEKERNEKDPAKIEELIQGFYEVEELLRLSVVQTVTNERGNFQGGLSDEQADAYAGEGITVEPPTEDPNELPMGDPLAHLEGAPGCKNT